MAAVGLSWDRVLRQNLFAHTQESGYQWYPEFISVNREENGSVSFTVRHKEDGGLCGNTVSIELTPAQAANLKEAL